MNAAITPEDRAAIHKYFGKPLEELAEEEFKAALRQLRTKYHPDNFEKFEDETVREMATDRFQQLERLAEKLRAHYKRNAGFQPEQPAERSEARYAFDDMKIEINTHDKDLKYHLFGTSYRWLVYGDRFKIPDSGGSIIIDEDHQGHRIGFRESIRLYLTFSPADNTEAIVDWLYERIKGRASSLLIEGQVVPIDRGAILGAVRKVSLLNPGG